MSTVPANQNKKLTHYLMVRWVPGMCSLNVKVIDGQTGKLGNGIVILSGSYLHDSRD